MDVSQYLSAAAYLDEKFRDDVLTQAFDKHRFLGPSYGVDVASVVRHCLESLHMTRRRDQILAGVLLVGIVTFPLIILWGMVAWLIAAIDTYRRRYVVVAGHLRKGSLVSASDPKSMGRRYPGYEQRLSKLADDQNVVVYSGYSPFVGSGHRLGAWSFAVNVQRAPESLGGATGQAPIPFGTAEIHDYVAKTMSELRLDGLTVTDRLFVDGRNVSDNPRLVENANGSAGEGDRNVLLENRFAEPRSKVADELLREFIPAPTTSVRDYMDIKVVDWEGELILSTFVRFWQVGEYLFMETCFYLLPPLKESYHIVDNLNSKPTGRQMWQLAMESLRRTPALWLGSPYRVIRSLFARSIQERSERDVVRAIRENRAFDYGAYTSIRQSGSASNYQKYFQVLDKERSNKIVERHLLDAVVAFLEDKGVDTSEFKQRMEVLYNSGIAVFGGSFEADNVNVGSQEQSFAQRLAGAAKSVASPGGSAAPSAG